MTEKQIVDIINYSLTTLSEIIRKTELSDRFGKRRGYYSNKTKKEEKNIFKDYTKFNKEFKNIVEILNNLSESVGESAKIINQRIKDNEEGLFGRYTTENNLEVNINDSNIDYYWEELYYKLVISNEFIAARNLLFIRDMNYIFQNSWYLKNVDLLKRMKNANFHDSDIFALTKADMFIPYFDMCTELFKIRPQTAIINLFLHNYNIYNCYNEQKVKSIIGILQSNKKSNKYIYKTTELTFNPSDARPGSITSDNFLDLFESDAGFAENILTKAIHDEWVILDAIREDKERFIEVAIKTLNRIMKNSNSYSKYERIYNRINHLCRSKEGNIPLELLSERNQTFELKRMMLEN